MMKGETKKINKKILKKLELTFVNSTNQYPIT